jgi:hypothetical protein
MNLGNVSLISVLKRSTGNFTNFTNGKKLNMKTVVFLCCIG